jgi:predicted PurR-regulated permease PerM
MPAASKFQRVYPAIFLAAGLYVFITNFALISPVLLSCCLILLITLALNPVVARLRGLLGRRDIAAVSMAFGFLLVVALTAWAFYSPLRKITANFAHQLPVYLQRLEAPLHKLDGGPPAPGQPAAERIQVDTSAILSHLGTWAQALASNTAALAAVIITVFVGVVYTLMNPRPVFRTFLGLVPEAGQETALRIGERMVVFVPRWAFALLLGMAVVGTLVFFAVWPILGFQNAILMAVIAFIFEAIPYVGAIVAGVPALLIGVQQGGSAPMWVVIAYVTIQLLEHNIINPLIVAGSVRQHPLAVIVSVLVCLPTFGVLGVLLAVPLVAFLQIVYEEIYRPRFLPTTSLRELDERARHMLNATPRPCEIAEGKEHVVHEPRSKRLHHERVGHSGGA